MSRPRLVGLLLALVTLVVYLPVTRHDFLVYDDDEYVTSNRVVQNGLTPAGLQWAFTTFHAGNWHPLTWLSHMADCEFFQLNAGAHHFVNVLFHAANAALLFVLLWRLTQKLWPSAAAAALFAWHPLHVESVAWIAERKDVLSTFFALLALMSYARYAQSVTSDTRQATRGTIPSPVTRHPSPAYWFALLFFALGLLAKPMLVTLPCVMLLLDYWPLGRMTRDGWHMTGVLRLIPEKIPFFLLAAASCVITFLAQHAGHAVASLTEMPLPFRLENAAVAAARYLLKMLWPADLAVIYPLAHIPVGTCVLAVAALIFISAAVWLGRRQSPCWLVGWLWFLGTLVPVIGLVQVGSAAMADRYTYIPSIGIFIAVAFGLHGLAGQRAWAKKVFPAGAALLLVVCVALTERQLGHWRDSETLFRHTLAVTQNNDMAHLNLGVALDLQGRDEAALAEYRAAVRINPDRHQIHFNIGNLLEKAGSPAEALAEYRQCIRLSPEVPALHNAAGRALAALGKPGDALQEFAEAARLDPHYAPPRIETARIFFTQGRDLEAVDALRIAVRAEPDSFPTLSTAAHYLAANENAAARDGKSALTLARHANELSGQSQPLVFDILGMAYAENGDFTHAVACARNALELADLAKLKNSQAIRQRLELYKNNQPWRESFRATNASGKE